MSARRRVLFVSGSRSDYDILFSVIRAASAESRLTPGLVVTGAHLTALHGGTERCAEADGVPIVARIQSLFEDANRRAARGKACGTLLASLIEVCEQWKPDLVFAAMDREEAMAIALAATYLHLPIVHLGGGDLTGDYIDDSVRHAVTRLSHVHLAHTAASAQRLADWGEQAWRIHRVGAPGLDRLRALADQLPHSNREAAPFAWVLQHPDFREVERSGERMRLLLDGLRARGLPARIGFPNSDPGHEAICEVIENYCREYPRLFRCSRHLENETLVRVLQTARVMIGNSSSALVEAPIFGLPAISPGPRQRGREQAGNVQFVDYDAQQIARAIDRAVHDETYRASIAALPNPYGDGGSGPRIARLLAEIPLTRPLLEKARDAR